jgi:hypothetical protein
MKQKLFIYNCFACSCKSLFGFLNNFGSSNNSIIEKLAKEVPG